MTAINFINNIKKSENDKIESDSMRDMLCIFIVLNNTWRLKICVEYVLRIMN